MHLLAALPPRALLHAVNSQEAQDRLYRLQHEFPAGPFADFTSWAAARHWLEARGLGGVEADLVLRPVLHMAQQTMDETWHDVLLILFWRRLAQISAWLSAVEVDRSERDSQIVWAFLKALRKIDLQRRPERIGLKLTNDTTHDVRLHFARQRKALDGTTPILATGEHDFGVAGVVDPGREDSGFASIEMERDRDLASSQLMALAARGRISRADALILIGCHLYGRSLQEMAAELGLPYETTKRRRQRAADYLRVHAKYLSPDLPETPLRPLRHAARKEEPDVRDV